jgi:primary-amine oxidase
MSGRFDARCIVGFLLLMVGGMSRAHAECTDPSETFVTTVSRTFATGSSWSIGVYRRVCEGLTIGTAVYQPAGGVAHTVLGRATIAEVHVPYHTGKPRFLDVTESTDGLGAIALALSAAECPNGTLFSSNAICVRAQDGGYGWKMGNNYRVAQAIEIFMTSQIGNYTYINRWTFRDDGSIEPAVGLTGRLNEFGTGAAYLPYGVRTDPETASPPVVALSHMHNFYYRLDFDIGGPDQDAVARIQYAPSKTPSPDAPCTYLGQCGTTSFVRLVTETAQVFSPVGQTAWVVYDKTITNDDGRSIGYQISPTYTGLWRGMTVAGEPWAGSDLWVTLQNKCERFPASNTAVRLAPSCPPPIRSLSFMLNDEPIDGADVVVWYASRLQHVPRDEDELDMPIAWTSFTIKPRNFYFQNPAP